MYLSRWSRMALFMVTMREAVFADHVMNRSITAHVTNTNQQRGRIKSV